MAEKWGQIAYILDREDREFEEAMKGQAGATFSSTKGLNKMGSIKMLLVLALWPSIQERSQNSDYAFLWVALISM